MRLLKAHPEIVQRNDALLCSINDRLGSLCALGGDPSAGSDIGPLGLRWFDEVFEAFAEEDDPSPPPWE